MRVFRDVPPFVNTSVTERGDHIETVTFTSDRVIVEIVGPPLTPELKAELEAYWHERIERITRQAFGDFAQVPAVARLADPDTQPGGMGLFRGPWV